MNIRDYPAIQSDTYLSQKKTSAFIPALHITVIVGSSVVNITHTLK